MYKASSLSLYQKLSVTLRDKRDKMSLCHAYILRIIPLSKSDSVTFSLYFDKVSTTFPRFRFTSLL
jgi:hypothetical protein